MYDDMRAHIQEMLDISVIHKSHSLWLSTVILVQKDGSLRFCVDLRKLNNWTMKDAYSLPKINEILDCLLFSSIDLKSGYWEVKKDKESKPLMAFTLGSLGFYECQRDAFWAHQCPCNLPETNGNLPWGSQSPLVYHLSG